MIKNAKIVGTQIDPEQYHRRDSTIPRGHPEYIMSSGELKEFPVCPHRWKAGYRDNEESTDSQEWGSLIDTLLLDPARYPEKYAVAPATYLAEGKKKGDPPTEKPWNRNATVCKEWEEAQTGKIVVKEPYMKEASKAFSVLKDDPVVSEILIVSEKQVMVTAIYANEATGIEVPLRGLIDIAPYRDYEGYGKGLIDLKTCISAHESVWKKAVFQHGYHIQAAFYLDLYNAATGEFRNEFRHIAQESFSPYEIGKHLLSAEFIGLGRDKYQNALALYCQCIKNNYWLNYQDLAISSINGWSIVEPEGYMI